MGRETEVAEGLGGPAEGGAGFTIGLRSLVRLYYDIQKLRIAANNRAAVSEYIACPFGHLVPFPRRRKWIGRCPICGSPAQRRRVDGPARRIMAEVRDSLLGLEKTLYRFIYRGVRDTPEWRLYLSRIRGVGPVLVAGLLTYLHPSRFATVSKLWKYCGLHVEDGRAPRRIRGRKAGWNPEARRLAFLLAKSFAMNGGAYKAFYHMFYADSLRKHPGWTKAHHLLHAYRVTAKLFLSHYWEIVRAMHGLPVRRPYIAEKEPHLYYPPVVDYTGDYTKDEFYQRFLEPYLGERGWTPKDYGRLLHMLDKILKGEA